MYKNRKIVSYIYMNYTVHSPQFLPKKIFCEQDMQILVASSNSNTIQL